MRLVADPQIKADQEAAALMKARETMVLSRWQLFDRLKDAGFITMPEALAALATGAVPASVEAMFQALPQPYQDKARLKWAGFQSAYRLDPMVEMLAQIPSPPLTPEQLDAFFTS